MLNCNFCDEKIKKLTANRVVTKTFTYDIEEDRADWVADYNETGGEFYCPLCGENITNQVEEELEVDKGELI